MPQRPRAVPIWVVVCQKTSIPGGSPRPYLRISIGLLVVGLGGSLGAKGDGGLLRQLSLPLRFLPEPFSPFSPFWRPPGLDGLGGIFWTRSRAMNSVNLSRSDMMLLEASSKEMPWRKFMQSCQLIAVKYWLKFSILFGRLRARCTSHAKNFSIEASEPHCTKIMANFVAWRPSMAASKLLGVHGAGRLLLSKFWKVWPSMKADSHRRLQWRSDVGLYPPVILGNTSCWSGAHATSWLGSPPPPRSHVGGSSCQLHGAGPCCRPGAESSRPQWGAAWAPSRQPWP